MSLLTGILVGLVGPVWHIARSTSSQTDILGSHCRRSDRAQVQSCLDSPLQLASFLAATARHSGDWLFALRLHPAASNLTMRQSELQSVIYVLGWTCVSRTFADVARRSTLAVSTALCANRPLVDRPDIMC